jgi:PAS domain S-box-containing protein
MEALRLSVLGCRPSWCACGASGIFREIQKTIMDILLVDDSEFARRGIRSLMSSFAAWTICDEAADGLQAIEKARQLRPNLILMDVSMPRMDGLSAARVIRREMPESRIILVSENDPILLQRQSAEVEADGYICKSHFAADFPKAVQGLGTKSQTSERELENAFARLFPGDSEMAARMRAFDWSSTAMGTPDRWPESLRTAVRICLTSRFPIVVWWGQDYVTFYNDAYRSFLGRTKHPHWLGRSGKQCWQEIWSVIGPMLEGVFQTGIATWSQDLLLTLDRDLPREEGYFTFSYSPIMDDSAEVSGIFCACYETTESVVSARRIETLRKLAAQGLEAHTVDEACESAAKVLAESTLDLPFSAIYVADAEGTKATLKSHFGLPQGTQILLQTVSVDDGDSSPWPLARVFRSLSSADSADLVEAGLNITGEPWPEPVSKAIALPIPGAQRGGLSGLVVLGVSPRRVLDDSYRAFFKLIASQIGTAISDATAYEAERRRAEALAEIDRAKTAFFSNVSHEFRTPLTLMLGPLQDLLGQSDSHLSPSAKEQLALASRNGARLLRLVNTLLDFSRIEAGRVQAVYEPTDIAVLTADLASAFRAATERAGLRMNVNCESLSEPVYVDRDLWEKIVLNLVSNAFKFTFDGEIAVSVNRSGDQAELRVGDTGIGIPPEELPKIFERFHRIPSSRSRTFEGSGIGLALVHELVKLHGGTIRVESEVGVGSEFVVRIPFGKDHLPAAQIGGVRAQSSSAVGASPFVEEALRWLPETNSASETIAPAEGELPGIQAGIGEQSWWAGSERPRVLVADDNADMRQYLSRLLGGNCKVETASDGESALRAVLERPPDLVVCDIMMPRLDGLEFLKRLRAIPERKQVPVILLSARAGEESRIEGLAGGADDYLVKPFSARELLARVQARLELSRARLETERAVRESGRRYRELIDALPAAIYTTDANGIVTHFNPAAADLSGRTPELGNDRWCTTWRLYRPDGSFLPHSECPMAVALQTGTPIRGAEIIAERPDGSRAWVAAYPTPILDESGRIAGGVNMLVDITAHKRAELALRASTERFEMLIDQAPLGVFLVDAEFRVRHLNPVARAAFGETPDPIGRDFGEMLHAAWPKKFADRALRIFRHTLQTGQSFAMPELAKQKVHGGLKEYYDWRVDRITLSVGNYGLVCYFRNISAEVHARRAIQESEERLRALAETLEAQVHDRTRELQERNVKIVRQSEQLRELSAHLLRAQDEERRRIARELHDSAGQTLTALGIEQSFVAAQLSETAPDLAEKMKEMRSLTAQLTQEIRTVSYLLHPPLLDECGLPVALRWYIEGLAARSGLNIQLEMAKDFGRLPEEMELSIFRVVQECLTNIHRHSGSPDAIIRIAHDERGVRLEIEDHGRGMSPERLAQVQSQGAGVGIRGMHERVHQLHGEMSIESGASGTKICARWPIAKTATPGDSAAIAQPGAAD